MSKQLKCGSKYHDTYEQLEQQILAEANYIIQNNTTLRETARHFGVSKSKVWHDLKYKLYELDRIMYYRARKVVLRNCEVRSSRGGIATREKYRRLKELTW